MASNNEIPQEIDERRLNTLGREVEMQTFRTNVAPEIQTIESDELGDRELLLKIVCIGGFTAGVGTKGVFIDDYLQVWPPVQTYRSPLIGASFYLKTIKWQRSEAEKPFSIKLQFWEIAEQERFGNMNKVYFRNSHGALVFWGTRRLSSLDEAVRWREKVKEFCPSIPCVLVTDNVAKEPIQWIGPGKIFESEVALDQFCKDHSFMDHFEIKSRDWESGEKSVFGQAVNCLLVDIFKNQRSEDSITN
ncbi:ras-related protein Rab-32-like [Oculina patagonica]